MLKSPKCLLPPPPPQMTEIILKRNTIEVIMTFLKALNDNDKKIFYSRFAKKYKNTDKLLEIIENCKNLQQHKDVNSNIKNAIIDYMDYMSTSNSINKFVYEKPKKKNQFLQQLRDLFGIRISAKTSGSTNVCVVKRLILHKCPSIAGILLQRQMAAKQLYLT